MADKKISALTAATTPLTGTEVLPIVQSGSTVKVPNNDLRPKQIQSNATSGVLQVVGPAAAATRVMTVPDANFTAARTDAAQSFTGTQTFTGTLVGNNSQFTTTSTAATIYNEEKIHKIYQNATGSFDICTITSAYTFGELVIECVLTGAFNGADQTPGSAKKSMVTFKSGSITVTDLYTATNGPVVGTLNFTYVSDGVMKINVTGQSTTSGGFNGIAYVKVVGGSQSSNANVNPSGFTIA